MTRLLEVIIDETAIKRFGTPSIMASQLRHLLAWPTNRMPPVRVIPNGVPMWEHCGHNFDMLSFAGTADRIGVLHYPVIGPGFASGEGPTRNVHASRPSPPTRTAAGPSSNATEPP